MPYFTNPETVIENKFLTKRTKSDYFLNGKWFIIMSLWHWRQEKIFFNHYYNIAINNYSKVKNIF